MRPLLIDVNNLSYSKETLIYYSRAKLALWLMVIIGFSTFCIYLLTINKYLLALIISPFPVISGYLQYKILKRINEVQFRINSEGIQFRNEDFISWNNIENERIVVEGEHKKSRRTFFIYYI
ncbi:MAG: hypothetical protein EOO44_20450 [Flavobacterium sp.]|nr:MAG: hypothetical protein EOO44_20450 [Flavobacterium sp.]